MGSCAVSLGNGFPSSSRLSRYTVNASRALLIASSYVTPHVLQPLSAGKYARYPSSWCSIVSEQVCSFCIVSSIANQVSFRTDEGARPRYSSQPTPFRGLTKPLPCLKPSKIRDVLKATRYLRSDIML